MATISDYFEQAQLSQAAYSTGLTKGLFGGGTEQEPSLYALRLMNDGAGMSKTQAIAFANQYTVIEQYTDPLSGFSATVFQDLSGQQCLAIRGTQTDLGFIMDGITDVGVFLGLNGTRQYQQLQTFYQSLVASGDVQPGSLNVTGHSLGGLLAQMFAVDHPGDINQTVTFNAPGVGGIGAEILDLVGIIPGSVPAGNVINVIADPGWSVTAGLGMLLGDISNVFIEDSGLIAGNLMVENHSIAKLTDTLAVYNLFATAASGLDSTEGLNTITAILQTSSSKADYTLESAVTALGELFVTDFTPRTGSEYDTERDHLYTDIDAISSVLENTSDLNIEALSTTDTEGNVTPFSPYDIESNARTDIAYRYALVNLNPFAVVGANYANFNQNGELDIYSPTTGLGQLSDNYLIYRAEMLSFLIEKNIHDGYNQSTIYFDDKAAGEIVFRDELNAPLERTVVFGSEQGELLKGTGPTLERPTMGDRDDFLFGMGGNTDMNIRYLLATGWRQAA